MSSPYRAFHQALSKLRSLAKGGPRLLYFVEYSVPADFDIEENCCKDADKGLLFVHVARGPGSGSPSKLLAYWRSEELYDTYGPWFGKKAGLPEQAPAFCGSVADTRVVDPPSWKKLNVYGLLLGLAAFLGALEALHNRYGLFFGEPDASIFFEDPEKLNFLEADPMRLRLNVDNRSRVVRSRIRLKDVRLLDEESQPVSLEAKWPNKVGPIDIGKKGEAQIFVEKAPPAGTYTLEIEALKEGGLVRNEEPETLQEKIVVWAALSWSSYSLVSTSETSGSYRATIKTGRNFEEGLDCMASQKGVPGTGLVAVSFPGVQEWTESGILGSGDKTVSNIRWTTPAVHAYHPYDFTVRLEFSKSSPTDDAPDWGGLSQVLKTHCDPV